MLATSEPRSGRPPWNCFILRPWSAFNEETSPVNRRLFHHSERIRSRPRDVHLGGEVPERRTASHE